MRKPSKVYDHGDAYKRHDMTGVIDLGLGKVMVHDIFDDTPDFMLDADAVFVDPPYNGSALSSYYTKAEIEERPQFKAFIARLFEVIDEIDPDILFMEMSAKGYQNMYGMMCDRYPFTFMARSTYYHRSPCMIAVASKRPITDEMRAIEGMDEEDAIAHICESVPFKKIADPCMGKGLVAFYASKSGREFAGTELNPKRLAVCVERVKSGKRGRVL